MMGGGPQGRYGGTEHEVAVTRGMNDILVGPRQLLWEKGSTERGTDRPLRPKDVRSMETLKAIIADGRARG